MTMTKKMISWLSILTVFLTLLGSCHNEDFAKGEAEPQRNNANFFKHTQKGGINAKSGVDYISILEAYNREKDFLSTMPDQQGMPIWDKMQIVDAENATGLMIPLSHDNESMSSVLFAILDDKNSVTGVKDYDNNMLKNVVYNTTVNKEFRERMLYTFMYMDNRAFGNEKFTNIPEGLFDDLKYNKEYGRIEIKNFEEPKTATFNETGKILWVESCGMYWKCSHHGEGSCDYCMDKCHVQLCFSSMVFIEDGGYYPDASSGSSGGGGGATPSPEGIPPVDPCTQSGMPFYRMSPQCAGNTGNTDISNLHDPCAKIKAHFNDNRFMTQFNNLNKQENFNADHEIGFAEKVSVINGSQVKTFIPLNNEPCSKATVLPADKTGLIGWGHTHHDIGCDGFENIKVPSPDDIRIFLFTQLQQSFNILGDYSDAYGLTVTSGGSYMLMYTGTVQPDNASFNIAKLNIVYRKIYKDLFYDNFSLPQDKVEVAFVKFLKENVNIDGLEVYKVTATSSEKLEYDPNTKTIIKTQCP